MLKRRCPICSTTFEAQRKSRVFCSNNCVAKNNYKKRKTIDGRYGSCGYCNSPVWYFPRDITRGKIKYCSFECAGKRLMTNDWLSCQYCEGLFYCSKSQQRDRNRKTCSVKCRAALQRKVAVERNLQNPPTQGVLNRRVRYSARMGEWRKAVFSRDDYRCQDCGARNGQGTDVYLQAHHIRPFALFPELRFELTNGQTLCKECHRKTPSWGRGHSEKVTN